MNADLVESWRQTDRLLRDALAALPSDSAACGMVDGYLDNNELGLAFDELVAVGVEFSAGFQFWRALEDAATSMELSVDDPTHGRSVIVVRHQLGAGSAH